MAHEAVEFILAQGNAVFSVDVLINIPLYPHGAWVYLPQDWVLFVCRTGGGFLSDGFLLPFGEPAHTSGPLAPPHTGPLATVPGSPDLTEASVSCSPEPGSALALDLSVVMNEAAVPPCLWESRTPPPGRALILGGRKGSGERAGTGHWLSLWMEPVPFPCVKRRVQMGERLLASGFQPERGEKTHIVASGMVTRIRPRSRGPKRPAFLPM